LTGDFEAAQRIFFPVEKGNGKKAGCHGKKAGCRLCQICRLGAVEKKKAISSTATRIVPPGYVARQQFEKVRFDVIMSHTRSEYRCMVF
jgi:hypothetical protein